jgi:hypothetical protein
MSVASRPRTTADLPGQLRPLLALRWRMVRSRRQRLLLVALALLPVAMIVVSVSAIGVLPAEQVFNILLVTPTVYLAFLALSFLVPLAAGGGYQLYPPEQLPAYPLRARTHFLCALVLVPANLAWVISVTGLVVLTTVTPGPVTWGTIPLLVSVFTFVVMATVAGHAVGWGVIGIRQTRRGRLVTWSLATVGAMVVFATVRGGAALPLLDRSPTRYALSNALAGYAGDWRSWATGLAAMATITVGAAFLGVGLTRWTMRRPGDHSILDASRPHRRRRARASVVRELIAVDRASVWRAPALRRGLAVLVILPGTVAMLSGLAWPSLILLPGLVAAGAALLYGVNTFALDSSGAVWLSTMPGWAQAVFVAKAWVVGEVAAASVASALVGGALRAPAPTLASQVTATIGCGIAAGAVVVASAMKSSLRHPHRAALMGPRDTPAPPGTLIAYSVKLATLCTVIGLAFTGVAYSGPWWTPLVLVVPFVAWAGLSLIDTRREWESPSTRARVVLTVAGG